RRASRSRRREARGGRFWSLAEDDAVDAPVARPALLVLVVTERELLAVADGRQPVGRDPLRDEVVLHRLRTLGAAGQVVLDGAASVGVPLELDVGTCVLAQPSEVAGEDVARCRV